MNPIEITCEKCDSRMRLSARLLDRIEGRSGRVTCKSCGNKLGLDARGSGVVVTSGGALVESGADLVSATGSDVEPHLSELPGPGSERTVSLPPPLPAEAIEDDMPPSVRKGADNPSLLDLVAEVGGSSPAHPVPSRANLQAVEAPLPPMRPEEDSLSPHAFHDEDDASLIPLGREFDSTPYAAPSPRDAAYESLYPQKGKATSKKPKAPRRSQSAAATSRAPAPPRAGELRRSSERAQGPFDETFGLSPNSAPRNLIVSEDGQLLNDSDFQNANATPEKKSSKVAWLLAAIVLLGAGVGLGAQGDRVVGAWQEMRGQEVEGSVPVLAMASEAAVSRAGDVQGLPEMEPTLIVADSNDESLSGQSTTAKEVESAQPIPAVKTKTSSRSNSASRSQTLDADASEGTEEKAESVETESAANESTTEIGEVEAMAPPFSAPAASAALREATALASACRRPTDPNGTAKVVVTFAASGRVTRATVSGPPYAGTPTGGCIASRFRSSRVPAFSGGSVTVSKTVTIR